MSELLDDVINYVIAGHLATAKDTDIFKDYMPSTPDTCIVVYEYAGTGVAQGTDLSVRSVQVAVRAKAQATAKAACWGIHNLLHKEDLFITLGSRNCLIQIRNTPIKIDVDELGRVIFAFNMGITTNNDF